MIIFRSKLSCSIFANSVNNINIFKNQRIVMKIYSQFHRLLIFLFEAINQRNFRFSWNIVFTSDCFTKCSPNYRGIIRNRGSRTCGMVLVYNQTLSRSVCLILFGGRTRGEDSVGLHVPSTSSTTYTNIYIYHSVSAHRRRLFTKSWMIHGEVLDEQIWNQDNDKIHEVMNGPKWDALDEETSELR